MKERKWILFRVAVYLALAAASVALSLAVYTVFRYRGRVVYWLDWYLLLFLAGFVAQIIFNVLNIQLIHYHLSSRVYPSPMFNNWHTVLLVMNSAYALGLVYFFLLGANQTIFATGAYRRRVSAEDWLALGILALYAFATIRTITGSVLLKKYLQKTIRAEEDNWLQQLGNQS
jgi:hypothetical protein